MSDHLTVTDRRQLLLAAIVMGGLTIAGLAVPGVIGGVLLLVDALLLVGLTTVVHTQAQAGRVSAFDNRNWALRLLVVAAIAAVGLVKIFHR